MADWHKSDGLVYGADVSDLPYVPDAGPTWLRPVQIDALDSLKLALPNGSFLPLAGGPQGFTHLDVVVEGQEGGYRALRCDIDSYLAISADTEKAGRALQLLSEPRDEFAGLDMGHVHVMGIVNVTPDSFSDGGQAFVCERAINQARQMIQDGASLIDVGGESTRPGAQPVSREEEWRRIQPVLHALSVEGICVSADTRHASIMRHALQEGARIINDVSGFTSDGAANVIAEAYSNQRQNSFAIAMHMQGTPQTMQDNPCYDFAPIDVYKVLQDHINRLTRSGVPRSHISIDPGFGFGKTPSHNRQIIDWTALFHGLGVPVLIGVSRKSTIMAAQGLASPLSGYGKDAGTQRLGGSLALTFQAAFQGAQLIRTHDVAQTYQALSVLYG